MDGGPAAGSSRAAHAPRAGARPRSTLNAHTRGAARVSGTPLGGRARARPIAKPMAYQTDGARAAIVRAAAAALGAAPCRVRARVEGPLSAVVDAPPPRPPPTRVRGCSRCSRAVISRATSSAKSTPRSLRSACRQNAFCGSGGGGCVRSICCSVASRSAVISALRTSASLSSCTCRRQCLSCASSQKGAACGALLLVGGLAAATNCSICCRSS